MMMKLAPILLVAYERPEHTRRTLEALKKNIYADQSELIVYIDGPRDLQSAQNIDEVARIFENLNGFKTVTVHRNATNVGLAKNITNAVTSVLLEHERVIVLEDDILTSKFFLKYMNDALELYCHDKSVMHVAGYMYPCDERIKSETCFLNLATCWGWATWRRSWSNPIKPAAAVMSHIKKIGSRIDFNLNGAYDFWRQLVENKLSLRKTWAIFWYADIYLNRGLSLHPSISLVTNIGEDGTGQSGWSRVLHTTEVAERPINVERIPTILDNEALKTVENYFNKSRRSEARQQVGYFKLYLKHFQKGIKQTLRK